MLNAVLFFMFHSCIMFRCSLVKFSVAIVHFLVFRGLVFDHFSVVCHGTDCGCGNTIEYGLHDLQEQK